MRTFLLRSLLFMLPFGVAMGAIFFSEVPRWYAYQFTNNDGCNITWIHHRIFVNPEPIQVAFIGSSHTGCGIDDGYVQRTCDPFLQGSIANLSYCGPGRNNQFVVVKDLLAQHDPEVVFIEMRVEEDYHSHRDFGVLADREDVLSAPLWGNQHYVQDVWKAFQVRYFYQQDRWMDVLPDSPYDKKAFEHSFMGVLNDTVPVASLERFQTSEQERLQTLGADTGTAYREYKLDLSRKYLTDMVLACQAKGTEVIFLYIPAFGSLAEKPLEYSFYRSLAPVWIPPDSLFQNPDHWIDDQHFNTAGARQFSQWLSTEITQQGLLRSAR